jgi:hypothetical protein
MRLGRLRWFKAKAKAIEQSLRLRLRSGLRQSGGRFAAVLDAGLKPRFT